MVDIFRGIKWQSKYPLQTTNTEVNICFSIYYTLLFLQQLHYYQILLVNNKNVYWEEYGE